MSIVPAKVAGVKRVVVVSPPNQDGKIDPLTLVACDMCGATEIYKTGGAQAIGALRKQPAWTQSEPRRVLNRPPEHSTGKPSNCTRNRHIPQRAYCLCEGLPVECSRIDF